MARHTNNNSFNQQLRELEEEDELQGYDIKNAKRSKKKKVNKFNKGEYSSYHDQWSLSFPQTNYQTVHFSTGGQFFHVLLKSGRGFADST